MDIALTREIPRSLVRCELTHRQRQPIDHDVATAQHDAYCAALQALGLEVLRLPTDEAYPDCCFVEDTAIVLDEVAVLGSPGVQSRRGEVLTVARTLARYRPLVRIEWPATLEGGDVLQLGRSILVGCSGRTNDAGIATLRKAVVAFGYRIVPLTLQGCLHLKSAVTALDDQTLLVNRAWLDPGELAGYRLIDVDLTEPDAANLLRVRDALFAHAGFPRTIERLTAAGYSITPLDVSEFLKAEAALTCKSLLFRRI